MDKMQPIGVLDSGVGGLSVLKCLHRRHQCAARGRPYAAARGFYLCG